MKVWLGKVLRLVTDICCALKSTREVKMGEEEIA
jgi:hypothetical protein